MRNALVRQFFGFFVAGLGLVCLPFAACSDDTEAMMPDGPSSSSDLAAVTHDLTLPPTANCTATQFCEANCLGLPSCFESCLDAATPDAKAKFNALIECAYTACFPSNGDAGDTDGGAGSCVDEADTSGECVTCLFNMQEGPACAAQLAACQAI